MLGIQAGLEDLTKERLQGGVGDLSRREKAP